MRSAEVVNGRGFASAWVRTRITGTRTRRNGVGDFMYDCAGRASSGCAAPQSAARTAPIRSTRHAER
jgi:hypothetical protein